MSWTMLPLRALTEQRRKTVEVQPGRSYPLLGVRWYGAGAFIRETVTSETSSASHLQPANPGDLIYNRLFAWKQSFAVLTDEHVGTFASNEFPMFRITGADPRFVRYALLQGETTQLIESESTGATATSRNRWSEDLFRQLYVSCPDIERQQRIADFLDDQVARIDNIIAARREQITLIRVARSSALEETLVRRDLPQRPLHALTDHNRPIQYGIVLPGPDVQGGVPIIKGGDIGAGRLSPSELKRTTHEIDAQYTRSRVRAGDIVVAIRGSVGEVAVVPDTLSGANLTQDSARIAPLGCDGSWLWLVLQTPSVQARIERMITGATVKGINIEALRQVRIPTPQDLREQREQAQLGQLILKSSAQGIANDTRSIELLTEYKQSLITAAVTGELDVSTASGRGIPS